MSWGLVCYFILEEKSGYNILAGYKKERDDMGNKKVFNLEEASKVGEQLGVKWDKFNLEQFCIGMNVELEHGLIDSATNVTDDDSLVTGKIALAHLNEFSDYYTRLDKMEKEADKFWGKD